MLFITVIGVIGRLKGKPVGAFKGLYSCKKLTQVHTGQVRRDT